MASTLNSSSASPGRDVFVFPPPPAHPVLQALGQAFNVRLYVYDQTDALMGPAPMAADTASDFPGALQAEARRTGALVHGVSPLGTACAVLPLALSKSAGTMLIVSEQDGVSSHPEVVGLPTDRPPDTFRTVCEQLQKALPQLAQAADDIQHELLTAWRHQFEASLVRLHEDHRPLTDLLALVAHQACKTLTVSACAVAVWDRASQTVLGWSCTDEDPRRRRSFQNLLEAFSLHLVDAASYEHDGDTGPDQSPWPLVFGLDLPGSAEGLLLLRPADVSTPDAENPLPLAVSAVSSVLQFRGRQFASDVAQVLGPCLRTSTADEDGGEPRWSHEDIRSFFSNLGLALSSALDLKGLLKVIVEHAVRLTHSDGGSIYLINDNQVVVEARTGFEGDGRTRPTMRVGERFLQSARGLVSVLTGDGAYRNASTGSVGAYLGVPLVYGTEVVGLLNLYVRDRRPYSQDDVELLAAFSSHATLAIENARAFEFEQRRAQEVTLLFLAARAIGQCQTSGEVLDVGADQMTRVAEVNRCIIMLLDAAGQDFYTAASLGLSEDQREFFAYYRMGLLELEPRFVETLNRGKNYLFTSAPADCPPLQKLFDLLPSSTAMVVPLLARDRLLGLIWLDDTRIAHGFTTAQSRLVQALAIHLGTAIHRARLLEQMEGNLRQIKTLYDVSTALAGTFTPSRVDEVVIGKAFELMGQCPCALLAFDENTKTFELTAHMALPPGLQSSELLRQICGQALKTKKTLLAAVEEGVFPSGAFQALLSAERFHSYMAFPLLAKRRVVGALAFFAPEGYRFPDEETGLVHSFANQVAVAIEGSRLHMVVRNKVRELATLFEVGKAITGSLRLDQVLEALAQNVKTATSSDAISIMLLDPVQQELTVRTRVGLGRPTRREGVRLGEGVAGLAAQSGRVLSLHDAGDDAQRFPQSVRQEGMRTILCVPMKARGRVIGLLNVYRATLYHHTQSEINLLTTIANQSAVAIENARLYEERNQVTQILREILIPQTRFVHEGLEIGHRFQSSMELSGDYYETLALPGGRVALTIADVSGKGPTAATYAMRTKYIVRAYALAEKTPEQVLTMTNPMISWEAGTEMFISLFHCQIDLHQRLLTYSSGGHEPALFWNHRRQTSTLLNEGGLLLGVDEGFVFEQHQIAVHPGDILVLYTDGVTECRNESGECFGAGRIQEILEAWPTLGSQALANKIFSSVLRFCSKRLHDDFSLLVVRF